MVFTKFVPIARAPGAPLCEASVPGSGIDTLCGGPHLCNDACVDVDLSDAYVFPGFTQNVAVNFSIPVTGTVPIVYSVGAGAFPAGVTMNAAGLITGTPTTAGSGTVTIHAENCEDGEDDKVLSWTVTACVVPVIDAEPDITGVVGAPFSITPNASAGAGITWTLGVTPAGSGFAINPSTGEVTGNYSATPYTVTITATNACGADSEVVQVSGEVVSPITFRFGNYTWGGFPDAAPVFTEADLTGVNALFIDRQTLATGTRAQTLTFVPGTGVRQVLWMADSLGVPTFLVSGLPWGVLAPQALTIGGVPGQVYFTSDQNNGGYPLTVS